MSSRCIRIQIFYEQDHKLQDRNRWKTHFLFFSLTMEQIKLFWDNERAFAIDPNICVLCKFKMRRTMCEKCNVTNSLKVIRCTNEFCRYSPGYITTGDYIYSPECTHHHKLCCNCIKSPDDTKPPPVIYFCKRCARLSSSVS